jgi:hypothetical protein
LPTALTSSEENLRGSESGVDGTPLDGGEGHGCVRRVLLNVRRCARVCGACSASDTWGAGVLGWRVRGIEPQHVYSMVIPDREDKHHTLLKRGTHGCKTSLVSKLVGVAECGLLGSAEIVGDGVSGDTGNISVRVGNDDAILDIEALNLAQGAGGSTVLCLIRDAHFERKDYLRQ